MHYYPLEHVCFLNRDRKGVHPDGWEDGTNLGGAEEAETVIRICYMTKKKSIFNNRKKSSCKENLKEEKWLYCKRAFL